MKPEKLFLTASLFIALSLLSTPAQALRVKQINPDNGILTLDDSRQVQLAGLRLAPEAFKSLAILFSNQEIEIDEEKALSGNSAAPPVYLSVKTLEIPFPFKANSQPRGSKVFLNEMLLSSGLAAVDEKTGNFKKKDAYLKLQEEARRLGKGMWSEEPSVKKK